MKFKNNLFTVAGAVALALAAGSAQAIQYQPVGALGVGVDTLDPVDAAVTPVSNMGIVKTPGTPIYVNPNGLGEVLHFPYYSSRDNRRSVFNITNTSGEHVVVKVIAREGKNSHHVLDFTIVMSPYDVWAGLIRGATAAEVTELNNRLANDELSTFIDKDIAFEEGHPVLVRPAKENTCVIAAFDNDNSGAQMAYTIEPLNHTLIENVEVDDLKEGYVNFIASGAVVDTVTEPAPELLTGDPGYDAEVAAIEAAVAAAGGIAGTVKTNSILHTAEACGKIAEVVFTPGDDDTRWTTFSPSNFFVESPRAGQAKNDALELAFNPAGNVLKGNFNLIDADGGLGAGNQAVALADFNQSDKNLVTLQSLPYLYEPTLASSNGLWNASGLDDVEDALSSHRVINEWINNADNGAAAEWVQTFPTKGYYTNGLLTATDPINQRNIWRQGLKGVTDTNPFRVGVTTKGEQVAFIDLYPYDREENRGRNGITPSPAPYGESVLPHEVNVITFEERADVGQTTDLLGSELGTNFDLIFELRASDAKNGWLTAMYPDIDGVNPNYAFAGESYSMRAPIQMPVTGFMFKSVKRDLSSQSYNMLIDHSNVTDRLADGTFDPQGESLPR